jgi:hypothetical protein
MPKRKLEWQKNVMDFGLRKLWWGGFPISSSTIRHIRFKRLIFAVIRAKRATTNQPGTWMWYNNNNNNIQHYYEWWKNEVWCGELCLNEHEFGLWRTHPSIMLFQASVHIRHSFKATTWMTTHGARQTWQFKLLTYSSSTTDFRISGRFELFTGVFVVDWVFPRLVSFLLRECAGNDRGDIWPIKSHFKEGSMLHHRRIVFHKYRIWCEQLPKCLDTQKIIIIIIFNAIC